MSNQYNSVPLAPALVFSNLGEIDPRLIILLGANVKVEGPSGASPIGYFGTGLKYAIAGVLRLGGKITVHSGVRSFGFSAVQTDIRGKGFGLIEMSEAGGATTTLGFTTDLGKNWKPWMLVRELWANAKDEGGETRLGSAQHAAEPGFTNIVVESEECIKAWNDRGSWLLDRRERPLVVLNGLEIYPGSSDVVYYQGIKVLELSTKSFFTWNVTEPVELTEDRTLSQLRFELKLKTILGRELQDEEIMMEFLLPEEGKFEAGVGWSSWDMLNSTWLELGKRMLEKNRSTMQPALRTLVQSKLPKDALKGLVMTSYESRVLGQAKKFLEDNLGMSIGGEVLVLESIGGDNVGMQERGKILLTRETLRLGVRHVAEVLLQGELTTRPGDAKAWLAKKVIELSAELAGEAI